MIPGRCYWCDGKAKRGSVYCAAHARPFMPGHRGRPPERVRLLRSRIRAKETALAWSEQLFAGFRPALPRWIRRGRERYGLQP